MQQTVLSEDNPVETGCQEQDFIVAGWRSREDHVCMIAKGRTGVDDGRPGRAGRAQREKRRGETQGEQTN